MKTVIEMAREAGWKDLRDYDSQMRHDFFMGSTDSLERLVELARADAIADEREACAKECEGRIGGAVQTNDWWFGFRSAMKQCAAAIRARSNT